MSILSVAIDGPGGAGKSTIAKRIARKFGFAYVDTGAIYRTLALAVYRAGKSPEKREDVLSVLEEADIRLDYDGEGVQHMFLGNEDVSGRIREPQISSYASSLSAFPEVRSALLEMQRQLAAVRSVVMDGRDIGTVVLPNAGLKLFLTASPEVRARRRLLELEEKGIRTSYEQVLGELRERDERDTNRAAAPLRQAEDAILVDSSELDAEQVTALISELVEQRMK